MERSDSNRPGRAFVVGFGLDRRKGSREQRSGLDLFGKGVSGGQPGESIDVGVASAEQRGDDLTSTWTDHVAMGLGDFVNQPVGAKHADEAKLLWQSDCGLVSRRRAMWRTGAHGDRGCENP